MMYSVQFSFHSMVKSFELYIKYLSEDILVIQVYYIFSSASFCYNFFLIVIIGTTHLHIEIYSVKLHAQKN
jgi:hypothetical protein